MEIKGNPYPNYKISASCGTGYVVTGTTYTDITNLSVTITPRGKPWKFYMIPDGSTSLPLVYASYNGSSASYVARIKLLKDATTIGGIYFGAGLSTASAGTNPSLFHPSGIFLGFDIPAIGTDIIYKLQGSGNNIANRIYVENCKLFAEEMP